VPAAVGFVTLRALVVLIDKGGSMEPASKTPVLQFLWHPGSNDIFSGYGLVIAPAHLVGLVMVDRPEPVEPGWLTVIERTFGRYQLTAMTAGGERGLVCQMRIAEESTQHLRVLQEQRSDAIRDALLPLLNDLPAVILGLAWYPASRCWVSRIVEPRIPLFSLGMVVGTPEAVRALEAAGHLPQEFLERHIRGDWGEVSLADQQENDFSLQYGLRILSAYTTRAGARLWGITEADRSYTSLMLPHEY
jgi:hypothetical protein